MSPRKVQVDWKFGIKHCLWGHPNHLDETHCLKCGFRFGSAQSRQPFRMRRLLSFVLLTTLAIYLTLHLSDSRISVQQSIALAQNTKARFRNCRESALGFDEFYGLEKYKVRQRD